MVPYNFGRERTIDIVGKVTLAYAALRPACYWRWS